MNLSLLALLLPSYFSTVFSSQPRICKPPQPEQSTISSNHRVRSAAYFVNWGIYARNYTPRHLPTEKLTHVLYAFANINPESGEVYLSDNWADTEKRFPTDSQNEVGVNLYGCTKQLFLLKKRNRHLKTLLSIGGWTYSSNFAQPASSHVGRAKFAQTATRLLLDLGFDGLDIDWEYPQDDNEAQNFARLIKTVRKSLDRAGGSSRRFLLTTAVSAGEEHYMKLRLAEMTPSLDFYNVMAYDYAGSWSTMSGHQANLRASSRNPKSTPFSTDAAFKYYTKAGGVPSSKLILGIPLYGRAFANTDGPGCPFQGGGTAGSWENGIWDYKDLPQFGAHQELESVFEQGGAGASWSYDPSKRLMISYDTVPMVEEKTRYILDSGFGGAVWWEASGDRREQNSTGTGGSLITTFAEGIRKAGGMLDRSDNVLSYPESRFENLKRGFPDE